VSGSAPGGICPAFSRRDRKRKDRFYLKAIEEALIGEESHLPGPEITLTPQLMSR
jgi:hypothetical protein